MPVVTNFNIHGLHSSLECIGFNNLIMLTRWWIPNSNLRHIYEDKKHFSVFWANVAAFGFKVWKIAYNRSKQKDFVEKLQSGYQKRRTLRTFQSSLLLPFPVFIHDYEIGWIIFCFGKHFALFSPSLTKFEINMKFCVLITLLDICKKNFFLFLISTFYQLWS
jgi:hypothetical protein